MLKKVNTIILFIFGFSCLLQAQKLNIDTYNIRNGANTEDTANYNIS